MLKILCLSRESFIINSQKIVNFFIKIELSITRRYFAKNNSIGGILWLKLIFDIKKHFYIGQLDVYNSFHIATDLACRKDQARKNIYETKSNYIPTYVSVR